MGCLSGSAAAGLTLLAVDDDLDFLSSIQDGLVDETIDVLIAQSTERALSLLQQSQIDVLLCSLVVAEADGYKLLDVVRQQWPSVARILVTTSVGGATARHLFPVAQAVVQKPVDAAALRFLLKHLPGRWHP